ncbi:MAG: multifunctional 2',3'-cyclic-nucleotide 2'-phosphodiesterase/5'-nucleotidase/3'-nucleotidase [Anaerolineae bacterium]|nr:multifunctional 2',3'-cyclic-nucleotide 2'-phosphodiesterase/5'-nucleotidase/3'-nucleotidase [Anaerolineae bacterium]
MRKLLPLMIVALLVLAMLPGVSAQDDETFSVTIMHTNDTHAAHDPNGDGDGGAARQATVVNQIRSEVENSLLVDAGDRFSGTLYHTTFLGQDQVSVMNAMGYDVMTLGNHEFDNGDDVLAEFVQGVEFPVLTANIDFSASPFLAGLVEPTAMLEVSGQQIGFIGLVTAGTVEIASPGDELVWRDDYAAVANEYAAELTAAGVNKIVLLTHTGINVDLEFIEALENIDLVVGGHSHTLLSNQNAASREYPLEFANAAGEPILYVQSAANGQYLGRIDLEFDGAGVLSGWEGDSIFLSRYIAEDEALEAVLAELRPAVDALREQPTGATTDVFLTGDRNICRVEECNLGNVIADAMRWETGAQIAIMNAGGIRADIDEGEITLGEVLTVQPFSNQIATFELTGADVIAALENGVSSLQVVDGAITREGLAGRFPQVSGLRYVVDASQESGSRIVSVEVEQEDGSFAPIDEAATYSVVTNNFVRTGGDGYSVFAENAINPYDFGRLDYEVTSEYLASFSPITAEVEGRIIYLEGAPQPAAQ